MELRRFIEAKPVLDYSSLTPGAKASEFVRKTAADLTLTPANGIRFRLTGDVALNDEQFATVSQGIGLSIGGFRGAGLAAALWRACGRSGWRARSW